MTLSDLMQLSREKESNSLKKVGVSEERIQNQIPNLRKYVSF